MHRQPGAIALRQAFAPTAQPGVDLGARHKIVHSLCEQLCGQLVDMSCKRKEIAGLEGLAQYEAALRKISPTSVLQSRKAQAGREARAQSPQRDFRRARESSILLIVRRGGSAGNA